MWNNREIHKAAEYGWKRIKPTFKLIKLDSASEDIILEYFRTELVRWQYGETVTKENSAQSAQNVLNRRRQETATFEELSGLMKTLSSLVPVALEMLQKERDEEAQQLAASMSAIKV